MEVTPLEGQQVPTEECGRHPTLYLERGDVVLRCENTLFRFYIGVLTRKSEVFDDMFRLAPLQPADSEKTVDGLPVVRLHDSVEDFAHLLSALLDYESLVFQRYIQYPRFAALLRLSMKYTMEGIRKMLVHRVQKYYPVAMSDYEEVMSVHGTAAAGAFTLFPHPNEVLKLFWECEVTQCLPVAFYEATVRGINSLTSSKPKISLPPQILNRALKALATLNSAYIDHIRSTVDMFRACAVCKRTNLISIERSLAPTKGDLSLSPLRNPGTRLEMSRILCGLCVGDLIESDCAYRHSVWDELPSLFGLPTWMELSKFVVLK